MNGAQRRLCDEERAGEFTICYYHHLVLMTCVSGSLGESNDLMSQSLLFQRQLDRFFIPTDYSRPRTRSSLARMAVDQAHKDVWRRNDEEVRRDTVSQSVSE